MFGWSNAALHEYFGVTNWAGGQYHLFDNVYVVAGVRVAVFKLQIVTVIWVFNISCNKKVNRFANESRTRSLNKTDGSTKSTVESNVKDV